MLTLPSPKSFLPGTHSLYADTAQPQVILAWYIRCLLTRPSHKSFLPGAHSLHADMAQSQAIVLTGPVTNHSCQVHSLLADTAQSQIILARYILCLLTQLSPKSFLPGTLPACGHAQSQVIVLTGPVTNYCVRYTI